MCIHAYTMTAHICKLYIQVIDREYTAFANSTFSECIYTLQIQQTCWDIYRYI